MNRIAGGCLLLATACTADILTSAEGPITLSISASNFGIGDTIRATARNLSGAPQTTLP